MKIVSNILGSLARAVGVSTPGKFESEIAVGPVVSPVLRIPFTIDSVKVSNPTDVQNVSCTGAASVRVTAAGGAATASILRLGAGLWRITMNLAYTSDYVDALAGNGMFLTFDYVNNSSVVAGLAQFVPSGAAGAPHPQFLSQTIELLLTSTAEFTLQASNNAAGQTHQGVCILICSKLL